VNLEDGVMTVEPLPGLLDEEGEAGGG
jgi:hypothetical protein